MEWTKKDLFTRPVSILGRKNMLPTDTVLRYRNTLRLYVAFTDQDRAGRIRFVDVDANNP